MRSRHLLPYDDEAKLRYLEAWSNNLDTDVIRLRQRLPQTPDNVGVPLSGLDTITIVQPPFTTTTSTTTSTTTAAPTTTTTTTTATPTTTTTTLAPTTTTTTSTTTTVGISCTTPLVVGGMVSAGNWVTQSGGTTNLHFSIDEEVGSANDTDYIGLGRNRSSDISKFSRSTGITGPSIIAITSVTLQVRAFDNFSGGSTCTLRVYKTGGATQLASFTQLSSVSSSYSNYSRSGTLLNTTPADWENIEIWFTGTTHNGGKSDQFRISACDINICYSHT